MRHNKLSVHPHGSERRKFAATPLPMFAKETKQEAAKEQAILMWTKSYGERGLLQRAFYYTQDIEEAARSGRVSSVRYFLLQSNHSLWAEYMALRRATLKEQTEVIKCFNTFGYYWGRYDELEYQEWLWRDYD